MLTKVCLHFMLVADQHPPTESTDVEKFKASNIHRSLSSFRRMMISEGEFVECYFDILIVKYYSSSSNPLCLRISDCSSEGRGPTGA